jgi:hypothetical protein
VDAPLRRQLGVRHVGLRTGSEAKIDERVVKGALMQKQQLTDIHGAEATEGIRQQTLGRRSMHSEAGG